MDGDDWRSQLAPDARQRIVNKIMDTLKRHLPFSGQDGLQELDKIAVRFEEKTYTAATSQSDYLRKISLKMLTMEPKSQAPIANSMQINSTSINKNPSESASRSMQPRVQNLGQPPSMMGNQSQAREQTLSLNIQNNMTSNGLPDSASLTSALTSVGGLTKANLLEHLTKGVAIDCLSSERLAMVDEQKEQIKTLQEELDHYKDNYVVEAYDWIGDLLRAREEQIQVKDRLLAQKDIKIAELEKKLQEAKNVANEEQTMRAFSVAAASLDLSPSA